MAHDLLHKYSAGLDKSWLTNDYLSSISLPQLVMSVWYKCYGVAKVGKHLNTQRSVGSSTGAVQLLGSFWCSVSDRLVKGSNGNVAQSRCALPTKCLTVYEYHCTFPTCIFTICQHILVHQELYFTFYLDWKYCVMAHVPISPVQPLISGTFPHYSIAGVGEGNRRGRWRLV